VHTYENMDGEALDRRDGTVLTGRQRSIAMVSMDAVRHRKRHREGRERKLWWG
jgi:hypothetical protein